MPHSTGGTVEHGAVRIAQKEPQMAGSPVARDKASISHQ
jgi:hypothetical protein